MTYKTIKKKTKSHVSRKMFFGAVIAMFALSWSLNTVVNTYAYVVETVTDQTYWFEYDAINPVVAKKLAFKVGEVPSFGSRLVYKADMSIRWEDTLWCENEDKTIRKYQTQFWPLGTKQTERKFAGEVTDSFAANTFWDYTTEEVKPEARQCRMCGIAIGYTPVHQIPKSWTYCTEWFLVNK